MTRKIEPWDRQPEESEPAFASFRLYRDMPCGERSLAKLGLAQGKNLSILENWSSRHGWVERVRLWDLYEDNRLREANIRDRRAMMRRIGAQAMLMQQIALNAFKRFGENANLTPEESARFFDIGARLEMRSRGEPEDGEVANVIIHVSHRPPEPHMPGLSRPEVKRTEET